MTFSTFDQKDFIAVRSLQGLPHRYFLLGQLCSQHFRIILFPLSCVYPKSSSFSPHAASCGQNEQSTTALTLGRTALSGRHLPVKYRVHAQPAESTTCSRQVTTAVILKGPEDGSIC